eukprot:gene8589-11652_t
MRGALCGLMCALVFAGAAAWAGMLPRHHPMLPGMHRGVIPAAPHLLPEQRPRGGGGGWRHGAGVAAAGTDPPLLLRSHHRRHSEDGEEA